MLEVKSCDADSIFRVFAACQGDPGVLILDVRQHKEYNKQHIIHSFCVRVSANGKALLDYSSSGYDQNWSDACWWDKHCLIYGAEGIKKDHPVAAFLSQDGHARSVQIYRDGFPAFAARYPFLCTAGVRTQRDKVYPSLIQSPYLYLGNWGHAENSARLAELGVKRILTIHNNPERLHPGPGVQHMQIQMADVDTEDISPWLKPAHDFIEAGRAAGHAVLVHCGAGVSRSAALCIGHLMQRHAWTAQKALEHVKSGRSITQPNDGFWRALCDLERTLGISERSNPATFAGVHGLDSHHNGAPQQQVKATFLPEMKEPATAHNDSRKDDAKSRGRRRSPEGGAFKDTRDKDRSAPAPAPGSKSANKSSSAGPVLEILKDGAKIGSLVLDITSPGQECIFGRLPSCAVPLEHLSISRQHAKV